MTITRARWRGWLAQAALLLVLGGLLWAGVANLVHNLHSRAITVGFAYLGEEAGFDISETLVAYDATSSYAAAFGVGLLNTLAVSAVAIVAASGLGLALGVARLASNGLLRLLATIYVETVRNVPLILQLLLWYGMLTELLPTVADAWTFGPAYLSQRGLTLPWPAPHAGWSAGALGVLLALVLGGGWAAWAARVERRGGRRLPRLVPIAALLVLLPAGLWALWGAPVAISVPRLASFDFEGGKTVSPEFTALAFGLSVYTAAFIAEIVRGGIAAVPRGQVDAAQALGMDGAQRLRFVVLPQALRVIVPPLTSQYLNLVKNSSLAVVIGYPDLVSVSNTTLNQTGQAIEAIALMMVVYLALSLAIAGLMNAYNRRVRLVER